MLLSVSALFDGKQMIVGEHSDIERRDYTNTRIALCVTLQAVSAA
ncbi:MAG: hypothetical protein VB957_05785 [Pseudomonadales bacterium]|jgi:hypothetical protein